MPTSDKVSGARAPIQRNHGGRERRRERGERGRERVREIPTETKKMARPSQEYRFNP